MWHSDLVIMPEILTLVLVIFTLLKWYFTKTERFHILECHFSFFLPLTKIKGHLNASWPKQQAYDVYVHQVNMLAWSNFNSFKIHGKH